MTHIPTRVLVAAVQPNEARSADGESVDVDAVVAMDDCVVASPAVDGVDVCRAADVGQHPSELHHASMSCSLLRSPSCCHG